MHRPIVLSCTAVAVCHLLLAADILPTLIKQVDPNQGRSKVGVVFDVAEVELTMDVTGAPVSLESSSGLPDYVVKALEQWQYSHYKRRGLDVPFAIKLLVPVAQPVTPAVERNLAPAWYPASPEVSDAIARGRELNQAAADALEADLPDAEALGHPRTSLLVYYATEGAKDPGRACAAESQVVLPGSSNIILRMMCSGSPFAILNSSGDPLADANSSFKFDGTLDRCRNSIPDRREIDVTRIEFLASG